MGVACSCDNNHNGENNFEHLCDAPNPMEQAHKQHVAPDDIRTLQALFKRFACQKRGFLCLDEARFATVCHELLKVKCLSPKFKFFENVAADRGRMAKVFRAFDLNGDSFVTINEFLTALTIFVSGSPEEKLRFAFNQADLNKNGFLDRQEVEGLLFRSFTMAQELLPDILAAQDMEHADGFTRLPGARFYKELTAAFFRELFRKVPDLAARIIEHCDVNNDEKITVDEWVTWFLQHKSTDAYRLIIDIDSLLLVLEEQLNQTPERHDYRSDSTANTNNNNNNNNRSNKSGKRRSGRAN